MMFVTQGEARQRHVQLLHRAVTAQEPASDAHIEPTHTNGTEIRAPMPSSRTTTSTPLCSAGAVQRRSSANSSCAELGFSFLVLGF